MTGLWPGAAEAALFASAVLVINATPGVDFLLTVSRTLQGGLRAGSAAALGISAGSVVHTLAAAFGLAALLAVHAQAFLALQWAGAAYLAWLGLQMLARAWRAAGTSAACAQAQAQAQALPRPWHDDFRTGVLTNVLNPKVALFFLAFLPQFVPAQSPSKTVSFLLLGGWFVVQSTLFMLALVALVALAARRSRVQASGAVRRLSGALGGALFIGLALRLLGARPLSP